MTELYYRIKLRHHITESYYRIILENDIMELYYGIILMKMISLGPWGSPGDATGTRGVLMYKDMCIYICIYNAYIYIFMYTYT